MKNVKSKYSKTASLYFLKRTSYAKVLRLDLKNDVGIKTGSEWRKYYIFELFWAILLEDIQTMFQKIFFRTFITGKNQDLQEL